MCKFPPRYLLTYRLSQDHLETLFSRIRRRGGWNNNPNSLQFKYALRALLQKNGVTSSKQGNCLEYYIDFSDDQDHSSELTALETELIATELPTPAAKFNTDFNNLNRLLETKSPYHDHVLHYIAGFIVNSLTKKIKCKECIDLLLDSDTNSEFSSFTKLRNRGGLNFIGQDVFKTVQLADRELRLVFINSDSMRSATTNIESKVCLKVMETLGDKVFVSHSMSHHSSTEDPHSIQLLKKNCKLLCTVLLFNNANIFTDRYIQKNCITARHNLTKKIIFLGH